MKSSDAQGVLLTLLAIFSSVKSSSSLFASHLYTFRHSNWIKARIVVAKFASNVSAKSTIYQTDSVGHRDPVIVTKSRSRMYRLRLDSYPPTPAKRQRNSRGENRMPSLVIFSFCLIPLTKTVAFVLITLAALFISFIYQYAKRFFHFRSIFRILFV